ncbi:ANTAR domain-containing protein [Actinomycetospora sp. OC33-EN08]|uniref:ANTAR domain-containing protein n=1 Tax=Actinomycetospora aurantiaca TaxID=3129233 RepID=A0ABU8MVQ1_9PSEU
MSDESGAMLTEVIDLLEQVGTQLDALDGVGDDAGIARERSVVAETGAMHRARASLAQDRAQGMRDGLEGVRRRAVDVAEELRRARAERRGEAVTPVTPAAWWEPVEAAGAHLAQARLDDPDDVDESLLLAARTAVPTAAGAGLVRCDEHGGLVSVHRDDAVLDALAAHARASASGPGPEALERAEVHVPDLHRETRWPDLAQTAGTVGVASVLAVRLTLEGQDRGRHGASHVALVLHAPRPHAFGLTARAAAGLFARQAAILFAGARRAASITRALESRDVIGQAKGILVARDGITPEEAFTRLTEASQSSNLKLRDVAVWLVEQSRAEHPAVRADGADGPGR